MTANVASRKICKELYKLSGWKDTHNFYCHSDIYFNGEYEDYGMAHYFHEDNDAYTPAYDLGYLLRKLPIGIILRDERVMGEGFAQAWMCSLLNDAHSISTGKLFATPEDAAAKLAIELFKQAVLTKEQL